MVKIGSKVSAAVKDFEKYTQNYWPDKQKRRYQSEPRATDFLDYGEPPELGSSVTKASMASTLSKKAIEKELEKGNKRGPLTAYEIKMMNEIYVSQKRIDEAATKGSQYNKSST